MLVLNLRFVVMDISNATLQLLGFSGIMLSWSQLANCVSSRCYCQLSYFYLFLHVILHYQVADQLIPQSY